jgi:hypothetical protein
MMAVIAVDVDGDGSGIEPTAPMAAMLSVAAVDGGGNKGIFTNASNNNNRHPCPHCLQPCPPLDENWTAGLRARHDASHLSLPP